jgi:hypothetical protein
MDTITPSPLENMPQKVPKDLQGVEKKDNDAVPVYELGNAEKSPVENEPSREVNSGPGASPSDTQAQAKKQNLLDKIQLSLKGKKVETDDEDHGAPIKEVKETPDEVWTDRVKKVIKIFGKKPKEEQEKAQVLEEGYLEEKHQLELKDNGDK